MEEETGSEANKAKHNECKECGKKFTERRNLLKHVNKFHGREKNGFQCVLCQEKITKHEIYVEHLLKVHDQFIETEELNFETISG